MIKKSTSVTRWMPLPKAAALVVPQRLLWRQLVAVAPRFACFIIPTLGAAFFDMQSCNKRLGQHNLPY
jgi:hypothetical protein